MSAEAVGNPSLTSFDVLVIGSGAGGSAVANILCAHGQKVLILEAGANRFYGLDDPSRQPSTTLANDELKLAVRSFLVPDPLVEPRTFRTSPNDGHRLLVGNVNPLPKTVGGAGVHADLKTPRYLETDFRMGTLMGNVSGASFADWPVDYAALEPFYGYMERVIGVQGLKGANPSEGPRSSDFPMPPGPIQYLANRISQGLTSLGHHPFPYPSAITSRPYDGRPPCANCGFCSGYGCPSNAKGSPAVTSLRKALLTGNCLLLPETRAVRLQVNAAGTRVTGVDALGPDGQPLHYTADRVVLAASPIEDVRLLLLSGGLGNSSGLVGRTLMFHFQTIAVGIFPDRLHGHRGRTVDTGFSDFRGVPGDVTKPLGGIVEVGSGRGPIEEASYIQELLAPLGFNGMDFKRLLRQGPFRDRLAALTMHGEDAPQPTNVVDLDPEVKDLDGLPVARVTYQNHPLELNARTFYAPKMLDILGASGAKYAFIAPVDQPSASAHVMGTLRFGTDPKTSVCDPTGKFHDLENLYAADGALFPTSGGYNPTLTIVTLATWVGAQMLFPGSPESALT